MEKAIVPEWMRRQKELEKQAAAVEEEFRCPKTELFYEEVCGYSGASMPFRYQCLHDRGHYGECVFSKNHAGEIVVEVPLTKDTAEEISTVAGEEGCVS